MDWTSLIGPAVIAAVVSGIVAVIGLFVSTTTARKIHTEKLDFDRHLAEQKFDFDKDLAERKFRYDRELHDHKRRVELAEELVAEFHQLRDVIQAIRSPLAYAGEGAGRPRGENETEEQFRRKETYYVPLARLKNNSEFISGLMSKRYRARTLFGADIDQSFQEMHDVLVAIQVSAGTLIRMSGNSDRNNNIWEKCEGDIWWMSAAGDHLDQKLCHASETVEAICRPILAEPPRLPLQR